MRPIRGGKSFTPPLQKKGGLMSICKRYIRVAYTTIAPKQALFTRLRCKQWTCDYCAQKNARMWQYWLIERLPQVSDNWWLVTLTAHSKRRTTVQSLQNIREKIDTLVKRIKRVFGNDVEYARVFEIHPTSEAVHVHIIMSGLTPFVAFVVNEKAKELTIPLYTRTKYRCWNVRTWFKKMAFDLGMGYEADVQAFNGDISLLAFYVVKYLTKEQGKLNIKHLRHVQVTRGIGKPKFEASYTWETASYITARTFAEPNTRITDLDTKRVIDNQYWEHTGYYPDDNLTS